MHQPPPAKRLKFHTAVSAPRTTNTEVDKLLDEIEAYLVEPAAMEIEDDSLYHPLNYWKKNQHRFPNLCQIANDILGIPASTGGLERIFNFSSDILTCKRNQTKPELFQMILYIKRNSYLLDKPLKSLTPLTSLKKLLSS